MEGTKMLYTIASNVNESAVNTINGLEKELGKTLLAFKGHELKLTDLDKSQLEKVQQIEKELDVSLIAVDA